MLNCLLYLVFYNEPANCRHIIYCCLPGPHGDDWMVLSKKGEEESGKLFVRREAVAVVLAWFE